MRLSARTICCKFYAGSFVHFDLLQIKPPQNVVRESWTADYLHKLSLGAGCRCGPSYSRHRCVWPGRI
jgi:hypothetical protein